MKESTFIIDYDFRSDVLCTIKSCNKALKKAKVLVEFKIIDDKEKECYIVTLKEVRTKCGDL